MSGQTVEKLAYMVNQIARNLALDATPVATIADHITAFWTPVMIDMLVEHGSDGLDPVATEAMTVIAAARANAA